MRQSIRTALVASVLWIGACGTSVNDSIGKLTAGGSSGSKASGGATGGSHSGGGNKGNTGGSSSEGSSSGGSMSAGGSSSSGGDSSSGGSSEVGGASGAGGDRSSGGSTGTSTGGKATGGATSGAGGSMAGSGGKTGTGGAMSGAGGSSSKGDAGVAGGSLPCNIQTLIATRCQSCHGSSPAGGAPTSLITYANLTKPDVSNPSMTEAEVSLQRMQSTTSPMPPAPAAAATAAEIKAMQDWINAGYPSGSCGGDAGPPPAPDPLNASATCTSKTTYNGGEGPNMDPGQACIACHSRGEGPRFAFAGTLYPTGHEPNNCNGVNGGGMKVVVTDSAGRTVTMTPNAAGNFYSNTGLTAPFHAKVVNSAGVERVMAGALTNGDCNSCHTQSGASGAPGRITVPM